MELLLARLSIAVVCSLPDEKYECQGKMSESFKYMQMNKQDGVGFFIFPCAARLTNRIVFGKKRKYNTVVQNKAKHITPPSPNIVNM